MSSPNQTFPTGEGQETARVNVTSLTEHGLSPSPWRGVWEEA
ncbi:hypothetical protein [Roseivirga pacifica]